MEAPQPEPADGPGQAANDASLIGKRKELRDRNAAVSKGRPGTLQPSRVSPAHSHLLAPSLPDLASLKSLDASLKRNTSFIKKLKTVINPETLPSLLADVAALKLEKYLSEVVASIAECRLRNTTEILAAVELCSAIHQRYADFAAPLIALLVKQLGPPPVHALSSVPAEQREKEDAARISRQRSALRLLLELYLVRLFGDGDGKKEGLVLSVVRDMVGCQSARILSPKTRLH
jgi:hypothetical protein